MRDKLMDKIEVDIDKLESAGVQTESFQGKVDELVTSMEANGSSLIIRSRDPENGNPITEFNNSEDFRAWLNKRYERF